MALPPLAAVADLSRRNIDTSNATLADTMLAVASAEVRAAAGSVPILQTTSTVKLTGWCGDQFLRLPGPPVQSVASVSVAGTVVTDWRLTDGRLWRLVGWSPDVGPAEVEVALTHGLGEVPADIVDLVCSYAAAGMNAAADAGYAAYPNLVAELDGDYSVTYGAAADRVATVMEIPDRTRRRLRARFGGGAGMVRHR